MRSLRIVLPSGAEVTVTPTHGLAACAVIAAACLLSTYVGLLHDAVERGNQWRAEQRVSEGARKAVVSPSTFAPARRVIDAADLTKR